MDLDFLRKRSGQRRASKVGCVATSRSVHPIWMTKLILGSWPRALAVKSQGRSFPKLDRAARLPLHSERGIHQNSPTASLSCYKMASTTLVPHMAPWLSCSRLQVPAWKGERSDDPTAFNGCSWRFRKLPLSPPPCSPGRPPAPCRCALVDSQAVSGVELS